MTPMEVLKCRRNRLQERLDEILRCLVSARIDIEKDEAAAGALTREIMELDRFIEQHDAPPR